MLALSTLAFCVGAQAAERYDSGKREYMDRCAVCHGESGKGMKDRAAIFAERRGVGFDGWISIEDGVDGIDQLRRSIAFLRGKIARHWR